MTVHKLYVYKALTWRTISIVLSFTLSLLFFSTWKEALSYTITYSIVSTILFYIHEMFYYYKANL